MERQIATIERPLQPTIAADAAEKAARPAAGRLAEWIQNLAWRLRIVLGEPIPSGELARFFERLAIMLRAGMEVPEAIRTAAYRSEPELRAMMDAAAIPIGRGAPLHEAL